MIPDFMVRYGNIKFKNGFIFGYITGISVAIIVSMLTDTRSGSSPRVFDNIASALNGRR